MTTLYMDIIAMRKIRRDLEEMRGQIQNRIQTLRRINQGLNNDWVGNSANEYLNRFNQIDARLAKISQRMDDIASELSVEIANWESIDRKFGV